MSGAVKPEDIEALVEIFQSSDWDELHLKMDGLELFLSNDPKARSGGSSGAAAPTLEHPAPSFAATSPKLAGSVARAAEPAPAHWVAIEAPNLGTFYRAPKPGAAAFVELGQQVTAETEVCLVEVMKLFTAVRAGLDGTIRRICVADGEMVEYGQTLFLIEPA